MLRLGGEIEALRDEEQHAAREARSGRGWSAAGAGARLRGRQPGFLPEANRELASAGAGAAAAAGRSPAPARIRPPARSPRSTPTDMPSQEPFPRVMVQVRLRCGMGELAAVLHALESGSPQLFIDNLDMLSRRSYLAAGADAGGALDVSFDLYGYLQDAERRRPPWLRRCVRSTLLLGGAALLGAVPAGARARRACGTRFPPPEPRAAPPPLPKVALTRTASRLGAWRQLCRGRPRGRC